MTLPITGAGPSAGGYTLLLDEIPAEFAVSTRKLRTAYAGQCLRLRRSSDNAESDFGFTGSPPVLDVAAITSWLGGASGYVVTWYDQSGNGNNAAQSVAANQPSLIGGKVNFSGGTDYLDCGVVASHNLTNNFSGTVWINSDAFPTGASTGLFTHQSAVNGWGLVQHFNLGLAFTRFTAGGFDYLYVDANPPIDQWHHFVGRINAGTRYTYLDSIQQLATSNILPGSNPTINTVIGRFYGNSVGFEWDGELDDILLFIPALTVAEIQTIFSYGYS